MIEVAALLAAFLEATGREAAIWERRDGASPLLLGTSSAAFAARTEPSVLGPGMRSRGRSRTTCMRSW